MADEPPGLARAYLSIVGPTAKSHEKALTGYSRAANETLLTAETGALTFKFNPKDYTIEKKSKWKADTKPAHPKKGGPEAEYLGAEPQTMRLEIFLDESDSVDGDVSKDVNVLMNCCNVLKGTNPPRPPIVEFGWGGNISFQAYMDSVSAHFTMFRQNGTPYRATCTITLKELPKRLQHTNPTSGTPVVDRARMFTAGDSLASLAYEEYRNPGYWRAIAIANGIDDPMSVPTGTTLLLPPPHEAKAYL